MDLSASLQEHPYLWGGGLVALVAGFVLFSGSGSSSSAGPSSSLAQEQAASAAAIAKEQAASAAAINAANAKVASLRNAAQFQGSLMQTSALTNLFKTVLASRTAALTSNTSTSLNMAAINTKAALSEIQARAQSLQEQNAANAAMAVANAQSATYFYKNAPTPMGF